ncbi:hypothetical protein [Microbacterium gilvum]|uniref:Uncharacterized protein n=1 Tax=Microbacterium gilvum TaxID=1336204 RepID=A0ABP8ZRG1_9MICO
MGVFAERDDEEQHAWAALPSEPVEPEPPSRRLDALPSPDPAAVDAAGSGTASYSIVFPVTPPPPAAADAAAGAPGPDDDPAGPDVGAPS